MKYIRTIDGIYEYEKVKTRVSIQKGMYSKEKPLSEEESLKLFPYKIIKQADTIEELCDEFIVFGDIDRPYLTRHKFINKEWNKQYFIGGKKLYGAIWTDKGLIYVAKMNEKGELELL